MMRVSSPPRFGMFEVSELADRLTQEGADVIRLTLGKSDLPLRASVTEAMVEAIRDPEKANLVYPAGLPQLREALARFWSGRFAKKIAYENVLVSTGTSTLFRNLFSVLTRPGDEVVIPTPYYPLYLVSATLAHARVRFYEIDTHTLRPSLDSLKQALTERTRVVILNNPGNPLGNCLDRDTLLSIDEVVNGRATIVSDEIYFDQWFDEPAVSVLSLPELKSDLIVTSAFSKGYRMYARRVGYCIAPADVVSAIRAVQDHTLLTTDPVPQFGAFEALRHSQDCDEVCRVHKARRAATLSALSDNPLVRVISPAGGFYFTIDCPEYMTRNGIGDSCTLAKQVLINTGVATVPGSDFGMPTALRLSFTSARYDEGVDRLSRFFRSDDGADGYRERPFARRHDIANRREQLVPAE